MKHTTTLSTTDEPIRDLEKLMRIAVVSRAMLDEARSAPCDAAGCERFRRIYEKTISELGGVLPAPLRNELVFLSVTFEASSPSPSEIRVAQAELVGWLEGLLDGIAASAMAGIGAPWDEQDMPGQYL
jgi:hypothetical protein